MKRSRAMNQFVKTERQILAEPVKVVQFSLVQFII